MFFEPITCVKKSSRLQGTKQSKKQTVLQPALVWRRCEEHVQNKHAQIDRLLVQFKQNFCYSAGYVITNHSTTRDMPITIDSDLDSDSEMTPVDTSACKEPAIVVEGLPLKVLKGRKYR